MRNVSDKFVQEIKSRFIFSNFFENHALFEWEKTVESDRHQMTIWRMRIAGWILMAIYRVSREECKKFRSVPYVKIYRYNPKHLYAKLNG
jgi:hypothetical protein